MQISCMEREWERAGSSFQLPEEVLHLIKDSVIQQLLYLTAEKGQDSSDIWRNSSWGSSHMIYRYDSWSLYMVAFMHGVLVLQQFQNDFLVS